MQGNYRTREPMFRHPPPSYQQPINRNTFQNDTIRAMPPQAPASSIQNPFERHERYPFTQGQTPVFYPPNLGTNPTLASDGSQMTQSQHVRPSGNFSPQNFISNPHHDTAKANYTSRPFLHTGTPSSGHGFCDSPGNMTPKGNEHDIPAVNFNPNLGNSSISNVPSEFPQMSAHGNQGVNNLPWTNNCNNNYFGQQQQPASRSNMPPENMPARVINTMPPPNHPFNRAPPPIPWDHKEGVQADRNVQMMPHVLDLKQDLASDPKNMYETEHRVFSKEKTETSQEKFNKWLECIGKKTFSSLNRQAKQSSPTQRTLKICEAQERVKQMIFLLAKLKQQTACLEALKYGSEEWRKHAEEAKQLQVHLSQHQDIMTDETMVNDLQRRVTQRRKKRLRQKLARKEKFDAKNEELEKRQELHRIIDNWQAKIQKEEQIKKQEKEVKAAADSILSEVRKKIADVVKMIDLLKGLQKLWMLRKDRLSRQGIKTPTKSDEKIEEQTMQQIQMLQSRKEIYLAEEKTLKVMLEVEQEETKEKEKERSLRIQQQKEERHERQVAVKLFGSCDSLAEDDPLLPYQQYYDQANHSFEAFLQIRRDWDMFLVPEGTPGGSRIPDGHVLPSEPSSDDWASAVKDE